MTVFCYNRSTMYNWSVDERAFKKDPEAYAIWVLEQMINFGLDGGKLNEESLRTHWSKLAIDPAKRRYLHFLLHDRLSTD